MDPSCLVSTVQAGGGGGVMGVGIFSWHTLGPLVPNEHRLNATAYLSIVADHVYVEWEIRIMGVQPTNLQQLRDAIMSILIKISEECFNTLLNLCHEELSKL